MKNIHVIATDKPSNLFYIKDKLQYSTIYKVRDNNEGLNIYITSNEEIKEGDWCLDEDGLKKCTAHAGAMNHYFQKIILTTDQDLIKDGVQAIGDEFLEWFVKNPSCETVKVEGHIYKGQDETEYKVIIPKEEPKQETLEEAAERFVESKQFRTEEKDKSRRYCFVQGAKWQAERMYSDEEVKHLMTLAFEQGFKKADVVEAGLEAKETDTEVNWIFLKHKK